FFYSFVGENGKDWAENFFLHHSVFHSHVLHYGGLNVAGFFIVFSPKIYFLWYEHLYEALKIIVVYYLEVVIVLKRKMLIYDFLLCLFQKLLFDAFMNQNIIRCNASLACI